METNGTSALRCVERSGSADMKYSFQYRHSVNIQELQEWTDVSELSQILFKYIHFL
jgi:hypothetical protein